MLSRQALEKARYFVDLDPHLYLEKAIEAAIEVDGLRQHGDVVAINVVDEAILGERQRVCELIETKIEAIQFRRDEAGKIVRSDPLNKQLAAVKVYLQDLQKEITTQMAVAEQISDATLDLEMAEADPQK